MIFCAVSITVFYKLVLFFDGCGRHSQRTQNNNCEMSLQYPKKELSYEIDFLHTDNHESLLHVDSIIFDGFGQAYPKYPGKFAMSLWHLKKEARNEVRDLAAVADSNTTLTSCYKCIVLPPVTFFLSSYGIHPS